MTPRQIRIALTLTGALCCLAAPADGVEVSTMPSASHGAMPALLDAGSTSIRGEVARDAEALPSRSDSWAELSAGAQPDEASAQHADDTQAWFGVPAMVPEPSTPALWLIGLAVLGWVVRRRS